MKAFLAVLPILEDLTAERTQVDLATFRMFCTQIRIVACYLIL